MPRLHLAGWVALSVASPALWQWDGALFVAWREWLCVAERAYLIYLDTLLRIHVVALLNLPAWGGWCGHGALADAWLFVTLLLLGSQALHNVVRTARRWVTRRQLRLSAATQAAGSG